MKNMKKNTIGLMIIALLMLTVSAGGHGVLAYSESGTDNDHHQAEHDFGLTHDNLAPGHSEEAQCHAADAQEFLAHASNGIQVIFKGAVISNAIVENSSEWQLGVSSPREKIPLFEFAKIHTTTLALRV